MTNTHIVFRVDSGEHIGSGHIMRCLTIAKQLVDLGAQVSFVSRAHSGHCLELVFQQGYRVYQLAPIAPEPPSETLNWCPHAAWLKATEEQDWQAFLDMPLGSVDWIIVDHFALTRRWHSAVKQALNAQLMVIDGLADRPLDCELLLDPNLIEDEDAKWSPWLHSSSELSSTRCFVGPQHFPLRREFADVSPSIRRGPLQRILICFGGVDKDNVTQMAIDAVTHWQKDVRNEPGTIQVDVVIGNGHPYKGDIINACKQLGFQCHVQTQRMAQLMATADVAIGAAGTMAWERCKMALPCIMVVIAENQQEQAVALEQHNAAINLGRFGPATTDQIKQALKRLNQNTQALRQMSDSAYQIMKDAAEQPSWIQLLVNNKRL